MPAKYYAVVTFGRPNKRLRSFYRTPKAAWKDAREASGTCHTVRVYECDTLALARSADISEIRTGERFAD